MFPVKYESLDLKKVQNKNFLFNTRGRLSQFSVKEYVCDAFVSDDDEEW